MPLRVGAASQNHDQYVGLRDAQLTYQLGAVPVRESEIYHGDFYSFQLAGAPSALREYGGLNVLSYLRVPLEYLCQSLPETDVIFDDPANGLFWGSHACYRP